MLGRGFWARRRVLAPWRVRGVLGLLGTRKALGLAG